MSWHIKAGDRNVIYFPAGEEFDAGKPDVKGFYPLVDAQLRSHPRLRRVLMTVTRSGASLYYVLHWSDGSDLDLLDEKVRDGRVSDADFAGALIAEPRVVTCLACHARSGVLVVDSALSLFFGDHPGDVARLRAHDFKESCPACGEPWGLLVVEFLTLPFE
jgi:hypothetical protein